MGAAVTLLGGFSVAVDGKPVPSAEWHRRQAAAVVKLLALTAGRSLHREQVFDRLWPELPVDEAAPRLHKAAHYARRALGPGSVVLADETVSLFPDLDVNVDAVSFEAAARTAIQRGDAASASAAADLYTGELLPHDPYEPWIDGARERLQGVYRDVLRLAGRWADIVKSDPADEQAHLELITAAAQRGDPHGALRQFERLERALRQELGVAPSRAAQTLRARLSAATAPSPAGGGRRDSGEAPPRATAPRSLDVSAAPTADPAVSRAPVLVGRADEQSRLDERIGGIAAGRGETLLISGAAGTGKTALLAWLEARAVAHGMRVGSGVAAEVSGAWPYAPVLEALADLTRRHPALLDGLDDALRGEIELGLSGRSNSAAVGGGHQRLFVAAAELLRLAAGSAGVVLVVDDAHAADESTLRLLHYLARSSVTERVLVVLAHRPEPGPALAQVRQSLLGRGAAVTIDLEPLGHQDVDSLIHRHGDVDSTVAEAIWVASGGVPFRVVEMTRAAAAGQPVTAAGMTQSLTAEERAQLTAAAVLGSTFDTDEFLAVTGLPEAVGYGALDKALVEQVIVRTEVGYAFRHTLIRDALLDGATQAARQDLHRRAAAALELLGRSAARVGHHFVEAGLLADAVPWMLRAALSEAALGAYRDALATAEAVLPAATGAERAQLLALRADMLMAAADAGAVAAYQDALAATDDPTERSRLRSRLARAATFAGDVQTATVALDGLELTSTPADAELLVARGNLALVIGDVEAADAAATEARQRVALGRPEEWQLFDLITLQGLLAHTRGEWFERLRHELRQGVRRPALAARIFDSHLCVAEFLLYGPTPYAEVLELAAELRATAERSGVLRAVAFAVALRGESAYLMGDLDLAARELNEAVELHRDIGSTAGEAHSLQRLAEVELASGRRVEANRLLHRALPLARFSSITLHLIHRIYGTMITAAADPPSARAVVDRARAAIGIRDYCEFCSIMLDLPSARACADVGEIAEARKYLQAAERSAARWEGTAWQAALLEARSHLAAAEDDPVGARRLMDEAAELYDISGQPLDARRCRV